MAPLPPIWDPAAAVDRLPQPFRMIDKILAQIVDLALDECEQKEKQRTAEKNSRTDLTFSPHAVIEADEQTTCFCPVGLAGLALCGTSSNQLIIYSARDASIAERDRSHTSPLCAVDCGQFVTTSARVAASVSHDLLALHEIDTGTCKLRLYGTAKLPENQQGPCAVHLSHNCGHVAICFQDGAVAVYEVPVPDRSDVTPPISQRGVEVGSSSGAQLQRLVYLGSKAVQDFLAGNSNVSRSHCLWQLQQRPDRTGKSDRYQKIARGMYVWWEGCNRLLLMSLGPSGTALVSSTSAYTAPGVPPGSRDWLLPHGITCACSTVDGTMMAFGLTNGTTLVWDDKICAYVRVLPRLPASITAVAYVSGLANKLLCTAADGTFYTADLNKPEESATKMSYLTLPVRQICLLPNDPYAICICPSSDTQKPRLVWWDVTEQRLVAELLGTVKQGRGFGVGGQPATQAAASDAPTASVNPGQHPTCTASQPSSVPVIPPCWPAWSYKDTYLMAGGEIVRKQKKSLFDQDDPQPVSGAAQLYMYKVDALIRHLLPEEDLSSAAAKGMFDRMLAEMERPNSRKKGKRVKMNIEDPDAPKIISSLRKPDPTSPTGAFSELTQRRHIAFDGLDEFDDDPKKHYPKETKIFPKEGYGSKAQRRPGEEDRSKVMGSGYGRPKLAPLDMDKVNAEAAQSGMTSAWERPESPPWHHTNPLARIHPDWEEAPILSRVMEKIGSYGGGRKKRDRHLEQFNKEMLQRLAKEPGPKATLLVVQ